MNLHASLAEIDALESVLRRALPGEGVLATKVTLAWHLRQRDSARALQLVQDVMPVVRAARAARPADVAASCHARAALAAAEASALFGEAVEAERCLADARAHLDMAWDAQAEGDAWLVEAVVARLRGQPGRARVALRQARHCFTRLADAERLGVAGAWMALEQAVAGGGPDADGAAQAADPTGPGSACDAIVVAARAFALSGRDPAAAARAFTRAVDIAQGRGLVLLEVACALEAGAAIHELGDYERAARCFDAAATRARTTGWPALVAACDTRIGALLCDLGAFDEGQRLLHTAIESLAAGPRGALLAQAHAALARTLLATGRTADALAQMDAAIALLRAADGVRDLVANLILQARVLAGAARPARAADALAEAHGLVEAQGLAALRPALWQAHAELHQCFVLPAPAGMALPTGALHFAEAALAQGQRLSGWSPRVPALEFLAERWAAAGDHERAYGYARRALAAKERETTQQMGYPLAMLRVRRHAQVGAGPDLLADLTDPHALHAGSDVPSATATAVDGRAPRHP